MAIVSKEMLEGGFWKAIDLKTSEETGTIVDEFKETEGKYGARMQGKIKIGSETKSITLNNTSTKKLTAKHGTETNKWVGKKAKITKIAQLVSGEQKDILYVTPK